MKTFFSFLTTTFLSLEIVAQTVTLHINVIAPKGTPQNDAIYIVGNHRLLGNWNPADKKLIHQQDSLWTLSLTFNQPEILEFKLTRGSFDNEAIYEKDVVPKNTVINLTTNQTITLRPLGWKDFSGVTKTIKGQITGTVAYHRDLSYPGLNYKHDIIVWLPPSYNKEPNKRYPVLYMHDGQNIIDPKTSSFGEDWQVDEVLTELIEEGKIEEPIVVGVYNSPDRTPELSDSPLGRAYAEFVVKKVKPLIDSTYRSKPDAKNTSIMGSSMGGLSSFLFVWWYPEVFSQAGCISSAFIEPFEGILNEVRNYTGTKKPIRIYLDDGGVGLDLKLKPGYDDMVSILQTKGYIKGKDLEFYFDEDAEHTERDWAKRVWRPIIFFYGK